MLLCIKHNIETIEEYALRIGASFERAEAIIKEKAILTQEEIEANCRLFNVRAEYFLALVE